MKSFRIRVRENLRLIDVVSSVLPSKRKAKRLIDEGLVCVNGKKELFYKGLVRKNSLVEFSVNDLLFSEPKVDVLFEGGKVFVFNKPPFINSNRDRPNLEEVVFRQLKRKIKVVHRLDKQTSGAILSTESESVFEEFKEIFRERRVKKEYLAVIVGNLKDKFRITLPLDGREAITEVEVIERFKGGALCKVTIPTGRKHQIRRHLSLIGTPLAGEFKYWRNFRFPYTLSPRIMLHSYRLVFPLPHSKRVVEVEAEVPSDFKWFLEGLRRGFDLREVEVNSTSQGR